MENVVRDLRQAVRSLTRRGGFTVTVVLTLALGLGANAGVFSLIHAILLKPLPYPDSERLVGLWYSAPDLVGPSRARQSEATYLHLSGGNEAFEAIALTRPRAVAYFDGERPERLEAATVTGSIFDVLQIEPFLGRGFRAEDDRPGAEPVVVVSHGFWSRRLGGDPRILERFLEIDGRHRRVIGVLPRSIRFPEESTKLWLPLAIDPAQPAVLAFKHDGIGRLRAGQDLASATRDLERLMLSLPDAYPQLPRAIIEAGKIQPELTWLRDDVVGDVGGMLWIVFGAVGVMLLVVMANVANLFAARADSRRQELAVRSALGASRPRLVRHLLVESLLLAVVGGGLGLILARVGLATFVGLAPESVPRLDEVAVDGTVVLFTAALSLVVGVGFGLAPALQSGSASINSWLRAGGRSLASGRSRFGLRGSLVVAQVALALVVLAGAGLLLRSFQSLRSVDPGFNGEGVVGLRVSPTPSATPEWSDVARLYRRLADRIGEVPRVEVASAVSHLPLRDHRVFLTYEVEGFPRRDDELPPTYLTKIVSDRYFETLGIPLRSGRFLERRDAEKRLDSVVVNSVFAETYWPAGDAIGRRLRFEDEEQWLTVVGVVGGVRDRELAKAATPMVYLPLEPPIGAYDFADRAMSLAFKVRPGTVSEESVAEAVRRAIWEIDPRLPIYDLSRQQRVLIRAMASTRLTLTLLAAAAAAATLLGAIGLYGVLAYSVGQRRREIGLRLALGAEVREVRGMVVGQALRLAGAGVVFGTLLALASSSLLRSVLFGVRPTDPATFGGVIVLVLGVAVLASHGPAGRAARVDPVIALREDL